MTRNIRLLMLLVTLLFVLVSSAPASADNQDQNILKVGSRGDNVSELQQLLKDAGFFPSAQAVTGYYGWITYNSVLALEKKYGLAENGQAGKDEWNILYGRKSRVVLGYFATDYPGDRLSCDSYEKNYRQIDHVAMFDFTLDYRGNLKGSPSAQGIKEARSKGSNALMVVNNVPGTIDAWSANTAISLHRGQLVANIINRMESDGYDGLNIDLEGISPAYKKDFNALLADLNNYLRPRGKLLTVAVPAKTSDNGSSWNEAYDYKTIGWLADYIVLMTYDEHWINGSPGPVASLPWVSTVLDYSTGVIPPGKILLGIGCYGYDWPDGWTASAVKWKDMPAMISQYGNVSWDNYYSVPCLTYWKYGVKHQVWYENRYSLAIKLGLVEKYNLGGIALWRLGFEDDSFWQTVQQKL